MDHSEHDTTKNQLKQHSEGLKSLIEESEAQRVEKMKQRQDEMVKINRRD